LLAKRTTEEFVTLTTLEVRNGKKKRKEKKRTSTLPWLLVITAVFSERGCEDVALLCSGTKEINVFKQVPIRP